MTRNEEKLCADIVEHYGFLAQTRILQEECDYEYEIRKKLKRQKARMENERHGE